MLDIVITHYKEEWKTIQKQFEMLEMQRGMDWNGVHVTVINDGGQRVPEENLAELSYPVEQVDIPHGGVSSARNAGIDHAEGEWIMFCDCDDCFENVYALRDITNVLTKENERLFDMLWGQIIEEDFVDGAKSLRIIPNEKIFVFCHGKVYRRAFLMEQNIRFDTGLTFNEDSCFNATIIARTPHTRIGEIKSHAPVYVWIRRENSVTFGDNAPDDGAYGQFRRNITVTEENRIHKNADNYCGMVTRTAYDAFYMLNGKRISQKGKRRIADEFVPWMREHRNEFGRVSTGILEQIRYVSKSELVDADERIPDSHGTVRAWIDKITGVTA